MPAISAPAPQVMNEDGTLIFSNANGNAIAVSDLDAGSNAVQLTLTATSGVLTLFQTTDITFSTGDGTSDASMTFSGTIASINAALNGMSFKPNADFNGSAGVQVNMSDLGNTGPPGPQIATLTVAITVDAVDDAPQNAVPGPQSTAQNTPLVFSLGNGNAITVTDIDVGAAELRVSLTATNGVLTLGSIAGLSLVSGDGTSSLVAIGTVVSVNGALNGLRFTPSLNYSGAASLMLTTNDQGNSGAGGPLNDTDVVGITVSGNVPPSVTLPGGVVTYTENSVPVTIAPTATVGDPDNPQLAYAVVRIAGGFVSGEDELSFVDPGGIAGVWNAATGTLTLTGAASPAVYQTALRSVAYRNISDNPSPALRTISFVVNDGVADGPIVTRDLRVDAVNDPPVLVAPPVATVDEDKALVFSTVFGNQVLVSDVDANAGQVELSLSVNDGVLSLAQTSGLTLVAGADGTSFLTISGTLGDVNAALEGLRFDPDPDFAGAVTLDLALSDLGNTGSGGPIATLRSVSIDVQAVNDAPVHFMPAPQSVVANSALVFSIGTGNAIQVDDLDATAGTLRVALTVANGSLDLGSTSGLIGLSGNGTSAVTFAASLADLASALEGLVYTPTTGFSGPTSLLLQTDDQGNTGSGSAWITASSLDIDVVHVAPTLTTTVGALVYSENAAPTAVDAGITITAGTAPELLQASVRIAVGYVNGQDVLGFSAPLPVGASAVWDAPSGTLTFSGVATLAEYETLLRDVTYENLSDTPGTAVRTVEFRVDDGVAIVSAARTVNVLAVNDAPAVSAIGDQAIPQGSSVGPLAFTVSDVETAAGSLVVGATSSNAALLPDANITLGGTGAIRTISLAPLASQYGSTTVTLSVFDGTDTTLLTFDLTVVPPNLPPVVAATTLTVAESAANGTAVGNAAAADPDPDKSFNKIYWTDYFGSQIIRANLDGSGVQPLVTGLLGDPVAITVDHRGGKLYWSDTATNEIWRSNLDGSSAEVFINTGLVTPTALEVDSTGGRLYWTDAGNSTIQRVNLDGTGRVTLLSSANGLSVPTGIDLDLVGGKMYWVDDGTNRVQRANLDGSSIQTLVTGLSQPGSIALDVANNKLYWSDPGTGRIGRSNLDGSGAQASFISVSGGINELAVDTARGKIYWTEDDTDRIRRANLDGTGVTTVVSTGLLSDPSGIALGPSVPGLSYAITGGNGSGAFAINAATGAITVANGAALNFETTPSYALTVQVTDPGGMTSTGTVTINLLNVNEAPTAVALTGGAVNENTDTTPGYAVGTLSTTEVDAGDTHTYTIIGGTDAAKFSVAGNQLILTDGVLDFETKASYQVTVRSTDAGGLSASEIFTVSVVNLPDAPAITAVADQTVVEDAGGVTVAFTVGDQDTAIGSLTVTAASGNTGIVPASNLVLGGAGANRTLTVTPAANAYGALTITLSVSDGLNTTLETFTLTVTPVVDHLLVVDTESDAADGDISSIDALLVSRGADGRISLREAILASNNTPNAGTPDQINFGIPGAGPHTINVTSALPAVNGAVILDATSQPGFGGAPLIELNGAAAGTGVHGLRLTGGASTVRGLVVNRFDGAGIRVTSAGNTIAGNYIGLDLAGNADLGNKQYGIWVTSAGNTIGGAGPGERNVVSGNDIDGIHIDGGSGNVILGNYVGTNAAGTGAVGNTEDGIWLFNASNNVVGGTTAGARNVLSGNQWSGIGFSGGGSGNVIRGNYIGVDATGTAALPNLQDGINILGSDGAQIGGTGGAENLIAFNVQDGIAISFGTGHAVLGNAIYANGGLGIDINDNGVTGNDAGDGDVGTNLGMNFPVIYSVVVSGGTLTVTGEARPGATVRFYEAATDPSGYGEGQTFIGPGTVSSATPGAIDGTARRFSFTFAAGSMNVGDRLTATATDASGNTSEFSLAVAATAVAPAIIVTPTSGLVTTEDGGTASFSVVLATQPNANVSVGMSSADATEGSVSTTLLTFTTGNWSTGQTVVVTGVPDALVDGSITYSIVLAAATSSDPAYAGIDPQDVSVTNLEGVNVAPVSALPGAQVVDEDTPLAIIGVSVSDSNGNLSSVQLGATNGTLSVSLAGGATISSGVNGTSTLTLSGAQTQLNAALATLVYQGNANFAGTDTLTIVAMDGGGLSDSDTIGITVDPMNDAAAVSMSAAPLAYAEDDPPTTVDLGLTVTDVDSPLLNRAHVTITGNYVNGEDLLEYVYNPALPAITATWDSGAGELALSGAASASDYQAALRSVTYRNLSDTPNTLARTVTIEVEDGFSVDAGSFASRTIVVATANDAPAIVTDGGGATASRSVTENTSFVTDVDATDIDLPAQMLAYSISGGADAGRFTIDTVTGVLSFLASPDREVPSDSDLDGIYQVTVQVSDGNGGVDQQAFTATVLDADEFDVSTPTDTDSGANSVPEDAAFGAPVGIAALATDADATTNTVTYSLADDAGGLFSIDASSGVVRVAGALDAETAVSHSIVVRAVSADGSTSTQGFVIAVTDVNDWAVGPVGDNDPALDTVNENLASGALVGYTALAFDPDLTNNAVTYGLLDDAGGRFAINVTTGVVTTAAVLDYEAMGSHTIIVRAASSDGSSGTAAITIAVGDVNEAPAVNDQSFTLDEDSAAGSVVGTIVASDPDAGDVLSYSILSGNTGGAFAIDAVGQVTVVNSASVDFETDPIFSLSIAVFDAGGLSDTATLTINLNNLNDAPVAADDAATTSEDAPLNASVAAGVLVNDTDPDSGALTVTAVEGNTTDVGNTIALASGALVRLNANGSYSYTPNGAFDWLAAGDTDFDSFSYEVSDPSGATSSATVTVTLTGVNDAPTGFNSVVTTDEDTLYVFNSADFGFTDPDSSLQAVTIVTLPTQGSLTLAGSPVAAGVVVSEAQISAGNLVFLAAPNQSGAGYTSFQVRVSDGLVTAAGSNSVTVDVAPVNDLPTVSANAVAGSEDAVLNLTAAHFTSVFSDVDGDSLVQVEIVSLPGSGSLTLSGTPVAVNDVIPVAQLSNLLFVPAADWNGGTLFAWIGHDGTGYSAAAADMTLALAPVNDAPVLAVGTAGGSVLWGGTLTLGSSLLQVDDVDNSPAQVMYTITALPSAGTLYRAGVALVVNGTFTQDDIAAGLVSYTHIGGASSTDGFSFIVTDGAGGRIGATAFDIAVGAPPVVPPVVTPPPPPPPPPPTGGGSTLPTSGGGGSSGGSAGTPAGTPMPVDAFVSETLEAALLGATAPQLNDAGFATRNSVDARTQRVQLAQVLMDRSVAGYTISANTLGPLVGATDTTEASEPLSVGGTLLSGPETTRTELLSAIESVTRNLSDAEFVGELDTMREQLDGRIEVQGQLVASSVAVTGGLSVGYVIWLLRGGLLLSSLLSSLPAWHAVDPMPVLARGGRDDDDEGADEDPLERLFGKAKNRLLGGWRGKGAAPEAQTAAAEATEGEAAAAKNATVEVTA